MAIRSWPRWFIAIWLILVPLGLGSMVARADEPILTITGPAGTVDMDVAAVAAIPTHETTTDTPWTDGTPVWSGPLLRDMFAKVGITAKDTVKVTALNDYAVTMPAADAFSIDVILATKRDGKVLSVRDKGPLFIIYPFAKNDALRTELIYGRSVWQVRRIDLAN